MAGGGGGRREKNTTGGWWRGERRGEATGSRTAVTINEIAYSATDPMARNARTVNAVMSLLDRARPEGGASVDAFSGAVSVVCVDIQNHSLVGNDLNACFSFMRARAFGVSNTPRSFSGR